ncbi:hypothetical protein LINPERHAP1_LOCUS36497 [Linum perenne]
MVRYFDPIPKQRREAFSATTWVIRLAPLQLISVDAPL